jgi:hypothetical protein
MSLVFTDKNTKEQLYSVVYFDKVGEVQEANLLAKNLKHARLEARKCFSKRSIIAVGLSIGVFENKNGIYI